MSRLDDMLEALEGVRPSGRGWVALCPAHEDLNPSLSICEGDEVEVVLKCFAGCKLTDIIEAAGLEPRYILGRDRPQLPSQQPTVKRDLVAKYDYVDELGELLFQALRFEPKDFRQRRPDGNDGWIYTLGDCRRVLYRLPELLATDADKPVYVVEGEKDVDRLIGLGLSSTTNPMGAGKWQPEYSEFLRGRHVVILTDNDDAGRKHTVQVATALQGVAASVRAVALPDLPEKGDVSDWLATGGTLEGLETIVAGTPLWEPDGTNLDETEVAEADHADSVPPFPTELLPGPFRRLVEQGAAAYRCPPDFIAVPLLVSAGSMIGDALEIEAKRGWRDGPNLYAAVVGDPGSKKSPALRLASKAVNAIQERLLKKYETALKAYKDSLDAWSAARKANDGPPEPKPEPPECENIFTTNSTVEALVPMLQTAKGVLFRADELVSVIGGFNAYRSGGRGADRQHYLSMWDRNSVKIDRRLLGGSSFVAHPCLSVVGGIQPQVLPALDDPQQRDDGFVDRFLFAYPDRMRGGWSDFEVDPSTEADVQLVFEWLYRLQGEQFVQDEEDEGGEEVSYRPRVVRLSLEARRLFASWCNETDAEGQPGVVPDRLVGPWAKLPSQLLRLALILHALKCAQQRQIDYVVEADTIADAAELIEYFKAHIRRALVGARHKARALSPLARKILAAIEKDGGLTQAAITRDVLKRNASGAEVQAALKELEADGKAVPHRIDSDGPGRPATVWYAVAA